MALPKVNIQITSGGLGRVPVLSDGIAGLLITGAKTTVSGANDPLYTTPRAIFSTEDLVAMSITQSNHPKVYTQVEDFYTQTGKGAELWIMLLGMDEAFSNIFSTTGEAETMAQAAQGRIRVLGISHVKHIGSNPTTAQDGLKGDIHTAVPAAQAFSERRQTASQPLQVIVAGNQMDDISDLKDYSGSSDNRVSMLISGKTQDSKEAALGLVLGRLSGLPVQRSLARVKNGALPISTATFTNGEPIEKHAGRFSSLHDKRYIFFRNYTGLTGYYIADDLTLTANTDDNATIALGRTIDKALRIAYITYTEELAEEVLLEDGKLAPANVKYLEGKIENAINETMTNNTEISAVAAYVDPEQDILATDELEVELRIVPVGYSKQITVKIGFINPQNV